MNGLTFNVLPREPEAAKFERDGVVRHYFNQWATVEIDGLPQSFQFSSDEPLPAGPATLDPKSFGTMNGKLALGRVKLVPLKKSAPAPAAQPK
ncbi:hypothetical protein [Dyella jiangningensis]|uniref:Uncharacterized protein n=1 Tax=Dyella jiangningensis TaxID=1379159 RepID=A0A023NZJ8_9GAMM|nr:hypothetical protein [Dyella jiangningensis]AHX16271.1 hypothetical protein CH75_09170 [Dyella jiangningensis]RAO78190.1 hypothetical protein CA260_10315 [Dyella jiangningensis]